MSEKKLKEAIESINRAYMGEDYDAYESRLERFSQALGVSYEWLEDEATTVRYRGWDYD